ncbi:MULTISPECIES: NlpC/P60 family protein [unclassified Thermosipho (in: thermotogales)]|uniref:C40 family peptidase n=1 Tax=unclassified Thermosipho (in: thermotogales) TaxID=2676525 RepID=UPI000984BB12|nr:MULTISPECIES: NlpC/P60 family protein [unclassified Thermosipho (in: thermotogales)]MBT1247709.1 hypothetical protein [Thermosipho sp. 1244]OOC46812.1 hypothetical protein XO09_04860 [Thermosipho sp. 1223]
MENYFVLGLVLGLIFGIFLANHIPQNFHQVPITNADKEIWFKTLPSLEGIPYRWGGQNPKNGFDCSGLIVYLYNQLGVKHFVYQGKLVYDVSADALFKYNVILEDANSAKQGDLIFFDVNGDGIMDHVAILDKIDKDRKVWIWDATDIVDGTNINKVSHRVLSNIWDKNPIFGKPLKVIFK